MAAKQCPFCGRKAGKTAKFCQSCGGLLDAEAAAGASKDAAEFPLVDSVPEDLPAGGPSKGDAGEEPGSSVVPVPEATPPAAPKDAGKSGEEAVAPAADEAADPTPNPSPEPKPAPETPGARAPEPVTIEVMDGDRTVLSAALRPGKTLVVGASSACDVVLPSDPYVSGQHLSFSFRDGQVLVADLGSTNGAFAISESDESRRRITGEEPAHVGQYFSIGESVIRLAGGA